MAKLRIMEPLDRAIFQKLEELQSNREVQRVLDSYSNLDEKPQEVVKALMALSLFVLPLFAITIFYGMNSSLKSSLETKKELLEVSQNIIREKAGVQSAQRRFLGTTFVGSMNDMQGLISSALGSAGIESSKISVSNFDPIEQDGFITEARVDLKFQGLSSAEFFNLVGTLTERHRVKFDEVSVKKNESTNLLEGIATLVYLSKDNLAGN